MPFTFPSPRPGYTLSRIEPWIAFSPDVGHRTRQVLSRTVRVRTAVSWSLTASEESAFKTWFLDTANSGAASFSLPLAVGTTGLDSTSAKFDGGHSLVASRSANTVRYILSAPLEIELASPSWGAENSDYPVWEDAGLPKPLMPSWSHGRTGQVLKTDAGGLAYSLLRQRAYQPLVVQSLAFRFTDAEFSDFLAFWEGTLHAGCDWFKMNTLAGDALVATVMRSTTAWQAKCLPGCRWEVSFAVETRNA